MSLSLQPIEYFGNVNDFKPASAWEVVHNSTLRIYFVLTKVDSLGTRRYIPSTGTAVSLNFLRSRPATTGSTAQTIAKTAVALSSDDKSMYYVDLTAADSTAIISGGVQLVITTGSNAQNYNLPYLVKKIIATPGY